MRKRKKLYALIAVFAVLCTACGQGKATSMRLTKTEGSVGISDSDGKDLQAVSDMGLYSGYHVDTEEKSYAWINLDSVKLAKMDVTSEVEIQKDGKNLELVVNSGSVFFNITEPLADDETLNIRTSTMSVGIRGTCGWVETSSNTIYVLEGTVECIDESGNSAKVSRGQKATAADGVEVEQMELSDIPDFVLQEERPTDGFGGNTHFVSWEESGLEDHVMEWKDEYLEAQMRGITGIYEGDIMLSDVWELTELRIWNQQGMEDISALGELTNLTSLGLRGDKLEDISALSSLVNLTFLDLNDNKITDISPLKGLVNLTVLDLGDNYELTDISALSGLTNLTGLSLFYNHKIEDISALSSLTNMAELDLFNTDISDISVLSNMTNLVSLNLGGCSNVSDISALGNLVNLTDLNLSFTDVTDFSPLDNLPKVDRTYY